MTDLLRIKLGPRHGLRRGLSAVTWYERGCALEASDPDASIAAYRRAIAGRPDLADAHNNLGRLLHDRRELAAAQDAYLAALRADASVALFWFNLGVVVEDRGADAEAITAYQAAIARDATLADAHFNLARLLERAGRAAGAVGDGDQLRRAVRHLMRYRELVGAGAHTGARRR